MINNSSRTNVNEVIEKFNNDELIARCIGVEPQFGSLEDPKAIKLDAGYFVREVEQLAKKADNKGHESRPGVRSKSATLLVAGVPMMLFDSVGLLHDANKATIRGYMYVDSQTVVNRQEFGNIEKDKRKFENFLDRGTFVQKYKDKFNEMEERAKIEIEQANLSGKKHMRELSPRHREAYNEVIASFTDESLCGIVLNDESPIGKIKALIVKNSLAQQGIDLPIFYYQGGKLSHYNPPMAEVTQLINTIPNIVNNAINKEYAPLKGAHDKGVKMPEKHKEQFSILKRFKKSLRNKKESNKIYQNLANQMGYEVSLPKNKKWEVNSDNIKTLIVQKQQIQTKKAIRSAGILTRFHSQTKEPMAPLSSAVLRVVPESVIDKANITFKFPDDPKSPKNVYKEILTSEASYLSSLDSLVNNKQVILDTYSNLSDKDKKGKVSQENLDKLISTIETLRVKQEGLFRAFQESDPGKWGEKLKEIEKNYIEYGKLFQSLKLPNGLPDALASLPMNPNFNSILIMPIQRGARYPILMDELIKKIDLSHPLKEDVLTARKMAGSLTKNMNIAIGEVVADQQRNELKDLIKQYNTKSDIKVLTQILEALKAPSLPDHHKESLFNEINVKQLGKKEKSLIENTIQTMNNPKIQQYLSGKLDSTAQSKSRKGGLFDKYIKPVKANDKTMADQNFLSGATKEFQVLLSKRADVTHQADIIKDKIRGLGSEVDKLNEKLKEIDQNPVHSNKPAGMINAMKKPIEFEKLLKETEMKTSLQELTRYQKANELLETKFDSLKKNVSNLSHSKNESLKQHAKNIQKEFSGLEVKMISKTPKLKSATPKKDQ